MFAQQYKYPMDVFKFPNECHSADCNYMQFAQATRALVV